MKSKIDPSVRAKLEELGADVVRCKLPWIMNVSALPEEDKLEPLGHGLSATRKEMQEWLKEKAANDRRWMKTAAIAAVAAAIAAIAAVIVSLLAWVFPMK